MEEVYSLGFRGLDLHTVCGLGVLRVVRSGASFASLPRVLRFSIWQ